MVVCKISSRLISGRIEVRRLASIVFPEPGGPIIRMLCPPAAAISRARLTCICPLTSYISRLCCGVSFVWSNLNGVGWMAISFCRNWTHSRSVCTPMIFTSLTIDASCWFSFGKIIASRLFFLACITIGKMPFTGRSLPLRESSPMKAYFRFFGYCSCPEAFRIDRAMGKSVATPSFGRSAGARLMV